MSSLKLTSFVLFVEDVTKSKDFYTNVMGQEVAMDINNINIGFTSGLAIWDNKYATNVIFGRQDIKRNDRKEFEIYFETGDIDALYGKVARIESDIIHPIKTQPWQQRVFRLYDPDGYIIEVGESMSEVIKRLYGEHLTIDEIAAKTSMPKEAVQAMIENA